MNHFEEIAVFVNLFLDPTVPINIDKDIALIYKNHIIEFYNIQSIKSIARFRTDIHLSRPDLRHIKELIEKYFRLRATIVNAVAKQFIDDLEHDVIILQFKNGQQIQRYISSDDEKISPSFYTEIDEENGRIIVEMHRPTLIGLEGVIPNVRDVEIPWTFSAPIELAKTLTNRVIKNAMANELTL